MNKTLAYKIQTEVNAALAEIAKRNGLSVSPTRGNFDSVGLKLSFVIGQGADDDANPEYARNLKRNGFFYGLDESFLGKTIDVGSRKRLSFQGLKGKKAALKAEADGKIWLYDAELVAGILKTAQ